MDYIVIAMGVIAGVVGVYCFVRENLSGKNTQEQDTEKPDK